ncbi:E3 ubiquitin-protein ligase ptr1 [Bienertia sinuspersici]
MRKMFGQLLIITFRVGSKDIGTIDAPLDEMEFQEEGIQNPPLLSEVRQDDGDDDLHWDSHDYAILDKEEVAVEEDELEEDEEEEEEEDDDGGVADDLDGIV